MSDSRQILIDTASRLFADACTNDVFAAAEHGELDRKLWRRLENAGLPSAAVSEARGGAGADLGDALALAREAGNASVPAPLAETLMAELMLGAAGLPPQSGPLTIGPVLRSDRLSLHREGNAWVLSGTLRRVPWARHAAAMVVIAQCDGKWTTAVAKTPPVTRRGSNFAKEPRDTVTFHSLRPASYSVGKVGRGMSPEELYFKGALFRAVAMAGALSNVLEITVAYAMQREQFGRPIGKFQAVQQQIAVLASQVAAASAAADAAVEATENNLASFEAAAAKARISEAAGIAAAIAHQVHGAMGFSYEYPLQRATRRLWSWRDEFGSESEWAMWIGQVVAGVGGKGLWPFLTSTPIPVSTASARLLDLATPPCAVRS